MGRDRFPESQAETPLEDDLESAIHSGAKLIKTKSKPKKRQESWWWWLKKSNIIFLILMCFCCSFKIIIEFDLTLTLIKTFHYNFMFNFTWSWTFWKPKIIFTIPYLIKWKIVIKKHKKNKTLANPLFTKVINYWMRKLLSIIWTTYGIKVLC